MICQLGWSAVVKKNQGSGKVLRKATALPLGSVNEHSLVEICCLERLVGNRDDPSSKVFDEFRRLWGRRAPLVSMATGTKECLAARATYFVDLLTAAFSATAPAVVDVS